MCFIAYFLFIRVIVKKLLEQQLTIDREGHRETTRMVWVLWSTTMLVMKTPVLPLIIWTIGIHLYLNFKNISLWVWSKKTNQMRQDSQQGGISQITWVQHHESVSAVIYTKGQSQNVLWCQGDHVLLWLAAGWGGIQRGQRGSTESKSHGVFLASSLACGGRLCVDPS